MVGGFAVFVVAGVCLIADIMQGIEGKSPGGLCGAAPALAISGLAAVLGGSVTLAVGTVLRHRALSDWRAAHPERPAGP
jgi:drug/metabolite transporter (DMT)-like permease